jgi:hypothetical protein
VGLEAASIPGRLIARTTTIEGRESGLWRQPDALLLLALPLLAWGPGAGLSQLLLELQIRDRDASGHPRSSLVLIALVPMEGFRPVIPPIAGSWLEMVFSSDSKYGTADTATPK